MKNKNSSALFIRMASRPVPRVQRIMAIAEDIGLRPVFVGAHREPGLPKNDTWSGHKICRIGKPFPLLNGTRPFYYVWSVIRFQFSLIGYFRNSKPLLIHASDIETMPASILYAKLNSIPLIYNVHDNLSQRYNLPKAIKSLLNGLEGIAVLCSSSALVPEEFRRDALPTWCQRKVEIVRNTPADVHFSPPQIDFEHGIRLFYGGWLDWGRGLREMISLVESLPNATLKIAGEGSPEIVGFLSTHERVEYLGVLTYADSLEEMNRCHFAPAFYRPDTEINRFSASNKLAEALAAGRPLLVNQEMKITELFEGSSAAIVEKYGDTAATVSGIQALVTDSRRYEAACHEARGLYEKYYRWDLVKKDISKLLTSAVGDE